MCETCPKLLSSSRVGSPLQNFVVSSFLCIITMSIKAFLACSFSLILILIIHVSAVPTTTIKVSDEDVTTTDSSAIGVTEIELLELNDQPTINSTYRQDEDDESSEEDKEKEEENEGPNPFPPPGYPRPLPQYLPPGFTFSTPAGSAVTAVASSTAIPKLNQTDASAAVPTSASAAAEEIRYSVSRIPIAPAIPTSNPNSINAITVPQKYKIPNKSTLATAATTTSKPLTFEEEWNLTNIFHTGPQGRADCVCGRLPFKVDDADSAGVNQYPWTVAVIKTGIYGGGRVHCAGTLINDKYVVTTSNCLDGTYSDGLQVWLTAHSTFQTDNFLQQDRVLKRDVVEIFMHPNYNRQTNDNDIALLKLSRPVDISISSYYVPICLPATENSYVGLTAKMAGWGSGGINNGRVFNSRICKEDVPVISNDVCNRDTRHTGKVTSNMMCAGLLTPEAKTSCLGDSGGPLMVPNGGRYTLIGVVSWGFQNRQSYSPIVYSKVSGYSDWILHNTRDADWCGT